MDNHDEAPPSTGQDPAAAEAQALQRIIAELSPLKSEARLRIIDTVRTFFGLPVVSARDLFPARDTPHPPAAGRDTPFQFSEDAPTAKQFLHDKAPSTDVERVACLAYYLANYRGTPHFKTKDITALNTEAAQRPFSNTAFAVDNAAKTGYLVPSIKGHKQLSAAGERYVEALPDRAAAREIMERPGRKRGSASGPKATTRE